MQDVVSQYPALRVCCNWSCLVLGSDNPSDDGPPMPDEVYF